MKDELFQALRRRVNHRGLVLVREEVLLDELKATKPALQETLNTLRAQGEITILSPAPFLALRLSSWSRSSRPDVSKMQHISSNPIPSLKRVPVSSSIAAAATREKGGAGEGERILGEVLAFLGPEADPEEFRAILAGRDPALIHRALNRVQVTKQIRVSRPALFRSLLSRLS